MLAQVSPMPKSNKSKRNDIAVKVDVEVVRVARIVAAYEDVTLAECLSEALRPILEKKLADYQSRGQKPKR